MSVERVECPVCGGHEMVVANGTRLRKHLRYAVDARGVALWSAPRVACEGATLDVSALVAAAREEQRVAQLRSNVIVHEQRVERALRERDEAIAAADAKVATVRAHLARATATLAAAVAVEPRAPIVSPATTARCADDAEPCAGCDHPMGRDGVRGHRFGCEVSRARVTLAVVVGDDGRVSVA